jgi:hypothetical protein
VEDGWHSIKATVFDGIDDGHHVIEVKVNNVPENSPPGIEIVEPGDGETVKGVIVIWMVAWDPDGNDQIENVWVRIDGGELRNATYNHTDGEGQWWYYEWDCLMVQTMGMILSRYLWIIYKRTIHPELKSLSQRMERRLKAR